MGWMVGLLVLIVSVALPTLDRLTDASVMRRDVNDGTRWWRLRERLRLREDPGWPVGLLEEEHASELGDLAEWRSRRRSPRRARRD